MVEGEDIGNNIYCSTISWITLPRLSFWCAVTHLQERQRKVDLSLRPAWAVEKAPGQPRTYVDIVRQHLKKKKRREGKEFVILTIPKNLKDENILQISSVTYYALSSL